MSSFSSNNIPVVWTIGHSDACAGTGVQADLHTFHDFELYGCNVVTAIVAQNSFARGYSVPTPRKSVVAQINALDSDMPAAVIKVGALPNLDVLEPVAKYLADYDGTVIYDLELDSCDGLIAEAGDQLKADLLPRVDLLVANTDEVSQLVEIDVVDESTMKRAAIKIMAAGARAVLITGAQFEAFPDKRLDFWTDGKETFWAVIEALDTANNRGGGNILSAALAASFARGSDIRAALSAAKAYVTRGIRDGHQVGSGPGSVAHLGMPGHDEECAPLLIDSLAALE